MYIYLWLRTADITAPGNLGRGESQGPPHPPPVWNPDNFSMFMDSIVPNSFIYLNFTTSMLYKTIPHIDGCHKSQTQIESDLGDPRLLITLTWPETDLGETSKITCLCGTSVSPTISQATRYCAGNFQDGAHWEDPHDSPCDLSDLARELCLLSNVSIYNGV